MRPTDGAQRPYFAVCKYVAACNAGAMTDHLPDIYTSFRVGFPIVANAQDALATAVSEAGPLGERELRLIKLAIAIGALAEGSVRSNTRRALTAGATADEIRQVALCAAITTRGFPAAVAALGWIADVTGELGDVPGSS